MMDVLLLTSKVVQTLRREGLWAVFLKGLRRLKRDRVREPDDFDLKYGTDTGGIEPLWRFKIPSPNARFGARYEATQERELADAIDFLREELHTFTFIDLGCGKGRTLLVASTLGFARVVGVEFVPELAEIARANLAKRAIANAAVLHADAAGFRFPEGNLVVYLYNPFSEEVLRKVIENLRECRFKRLYVVYKGPQCAEVFDSSGFLKRFESSPAARHIRIWSAAG